MGTWHDAEWASTLSSGVPVRDRRSGRFQWFLPGPLCGLAVRPPATLDHRLARAERAVRQLNNGPGAEDLAGLARFLLRSEAIASSRIEGIAPAARQVAFAELALEEEIHGYSEQAQLVARNMTLVREASTRLASADSIRVADIEELHTSLLSDEPRHHGLRTVQNWIGGSNHHPLDADFVPPAPEHVSAMMQDLVDYLNGASHSPLVQAALVHAQFETIHPFTDGNGRVGRALIHTVLSRRGLTPSAVLPVSLVLATFRDDYVRGLTKFRHDDPRAAEQATNAWIEEFTTAVLRAAAQADELRTQVTELRDLWAARLDEHRSKSGRQRSMRSDSSTGQILTDLPSTPVLTVQTVERIHQVSAPAANKALTELEAAGILEQKSAGRRTRAFVATEVLDLITHTERRLASTQFDTRVSAPNRDVPARPQPQENR